LEYQLNTTSDFTAIPHPNARLETVAKKVTFRHAYENNHCLVPMNSYFEWLSSSKFKQPYLFKMKDDSIFSVAGIWERPEHPGEPATFAVLTTKPNSLVAKIHDRMPVILRKDQEDMWLREVGNGVVSLVDTQFPAELMTYYPVTQKMNKVAFNDPEAV